MPVSKEVRDQRINAGMCVQCGTNPKEGDTKQCADCKATNAIQRKEQRRRKETTGICNQPGCKNAAKPNRKMCQECITRSSAATSLAQKQKKAAGFCPHCPFGTPCVPGNTLCQKHLDYLSDYGNAAYDKCKEEGICHFCPIPKAKAVLGTANCEKHRQDATERDRIVRTNNKKLVFDHYGRKCRCCGLSWFRGMQIDHIEGGGTKHLKEIGQGNLYRWLVKNSFPEGYQTLCAFCNWLKGSNKECPHIFLPEYLEELRKLNKKYGEIKV